MFLCRNAELHILNSRYEDGAFECMIIYGRRRIGKTALISEFCKDKPTVFFSALNASAEENLEALSRAIRLCQDPESDTFPVYRNFDDALQEITCMADSRRLIFVIDEYPYLAYADKSISSRLQHLIDHTWQNGQLFLILCGSSMHFMENQVLGYQSPLYGRRTGQMKLQALTYREITAFYPDLSAEDQALLYGITGGIPHYLNKLNIKTDIHDALLTHFFDPSAYLFEEPGNLLKQELREPAIYNSIISAVATGASHSNEISTKAGLESGACAKYLRVLLNLGILKKESPVTEKSRKKSIYQIDDNFFRFWYRFVPQNMSVISTGRFRQFYDRAVKAHLSDYMGLIFEKMCREYLLRYVTDLPVDLQEIGQWWGTDPLTRRQIQIDIVGVPFEGNTYLIGSCKYRNEKIGVDEFELLKSYAGIFRKDASFYYYIFAKGGFTENLKQLALQGDITLITLEDLYDI